ncbi:signal peptidase II [Limibaculum sp. FT325]|uniref:signal peptidase II n=1 Tax=Thermohalobaculum sediminis TaxID=2939436 RepID=UPI0020C1515F|nr:signal peptidase II [Limibaculum sediminis]MCL5779142.1 signal peptidase II [Limibaculum sediminis]
MRALALAAASVFVVDRLTKWLVVEVMDLANRLHIEVVSPFLNFVMAWNRGINFGLGASGSDAMRWALVALALAVSAGLAVWVLRRGRAGLAAFAGLVIGGALGNAWDRVQYGAVADFLNMSCCGIVNPFAFNVADIAIFAGAVLIAWRA